MEADREGMRHPKLSFLRTILIIFLAVGAASLVTIHGDNVSPVGWNLSGGGFCQGTYTIFNTTASPNPGLYSQNCSTGKNDCFSSTDFGSVFNCSRALMTGGGTINVRQGIFAAVTPAIFSTTTQSFFSCGITLSGTTGQGSNIGGASPVNGTVLVAKTNSMAVIEDTPTPGSSAPSLIGCKIQDITCQLTGVTNGVCVDFRMHETRTDNKFLHIGVDCQSATNCAAGTGLNIDGNEDSQVVDYNGGGLYGTSTSEDIHWFDVSGNVIIEDSAFTIAFLGGQTVSITGSTISQLNIGTTTLSLSFVNDYLGNAPAVGLGGRVNLNAQTTYSLIFTGCYISTTSTIPMFVSAGTIKNTTFNSNSWAFGASSVWNSGGTLTKQNTNGGNSVQSGTAPTGFPFSIDGNGNF
jgi:hypothetical protein